MVGCQLAKSLEIPVEAVLTVEEGTVGVRMGDSSTTLGNVGGNGDSVALWLAIIALTLSPVLGGFFYKQVLRPWRLRHNGP